jgi:O-acetyl-ADP-ribose deacetylase (regulator of RNase III)
VRYPRLLVKVYIAHDILDSPPLPHRYRFLINPANEALSGTRQPYFPIGGPVPTIKLESALSTSRWGGMDAGANMLYAVQVLDGAVHAQCGPQLLSFLQKLPEQSPFVDQAGQRIRCPVGSAVKSPSFGSLATRFTEIIHTAPPFQSDPDWEALLLRSYLSSFRLAWPLGEMALRPSVVATVLLGAGCRGISVNNAARVAAQACAAFDQEVLPTDSESVCAAVDLAFGDMGDDDDASHACQRVLHFILRERDHCERLVGRMKAQL